MKREQVKTLLGSGKYTPPKKPTMKELALEAWRSAMDAIYWLEHSCDPEVRENLKRRVLSWPVLEDAPGEGYPFKIKGRMAPGGLNHIIFVAWHELKDGLPPLTKDLESRKVWKDAIADYVWDHPVYRKWLTEGQLAESIKDRAEHFSYKDGVPESVQNAFKERIMDALNKYVQ